MLRLFKRLACAYFPNIVNDYRLVRDSRAFRRQKPALQSHGFTLLGNASMVLGSFEPQETSVILECLKTAEVFIDVGANIGFYTCLARSQNKYVVAVEPLAQNLHYLYANLNANGWSDVEIFPVGLSARPGLATLYGGGTGASLLQGWAGTAQEWRRLIPLSTLDILLDGRFDNQRLVIKVDVEGAEFGVLEGALKTLRRSPKPVWLVEVTLTLHHPGVNPNFAGLFEMFWANGYEARTGDREQRLVLEADMQRWGKTGACDFGGYNWLFLPQG